MEDGHFHSQIDGLQQWLQQPAAAAAAAAAVAAAAISTTAAALPLLRSLPLAYQNHFWLSRRPLPPRRPPPRDRRWTSCRRQSVIGQSVGWLVSWVGLGFDSYAMSTPISTPMPKSTSLSSSWLQEEKVQSRSHSLTSNK